MTPGALAALLAASALAPAPAGDDDWGVFRNDLETIEFRAPPGYREVPITNPNFVKHIQYDEGDYKSSVIKVAAYQGQTKIESFMKFLEKDIGGSVTYEEGSTTRYQAEIQGEQGFVYIALVDAKVEGKYGYYMKILAKKEVFEGHREVWQKVVASFKTFQEPQEAYEVPKDWLVVKNAVYAVFGPAAEVKDKEARKAFEKRIYFVATKLELEAMTAMFRELTSDRRKSVLRSPARVLPTPEAFKAAAGAHWREGATVLYLHDHKDRILLVDGSPDAVLDEALLAGEAGAQYMDTRIGRMWPWLREAVRLYFENGFRRRFVLGAFPPEMQRRAKDVFGGRPPTLEDLMKRDDAGMRELGEAGRVAAWGIFQCGLHGDDDAVRILFRKFLRDAVGAPELGPVWEKAVAAYAEATKKKFKPKDVDSATKKYFKEMKEEKR